MDRHKKKIFIIKAGSTFPETARKYGDFEEMTLRVLRVDRNNVAIVNTPEGDDLPAPANCGGVVITGAHCMVTDNLPWSLAIEAWIAVLIDAQVPILGICYGHQLLGRAMGGKVDDHPHGKEVGTYDITLRPESREDPIFSKLPQHFSVHATHSQSVLALPPGAVLLAGNDFEPHHAFRIGPHAWGVQFHPEYDSNIERDYIMAQASSLSEAGQDVDLLLSNVRDTPVAASILDKFARLALN